jgi:branched-chain amino acid transport system ATP-binding protein
MQTLDLARQAGKPSQHPLEGPVLNCTNQSAFYGRIQVVFGVSLAIAPGECVAVLGPNGAGKTSLLGAIGGTVRATGETRFNGDDIGRLSAYRRARVGLSYVPEAHRNLFPSMSVRENLDMGLSLSPQPVRPEILHFIVHLFPILKSRMATAAVMLSGGEQQMLAIAIALGRRPTVLLLDEPSQGLAPAVFDILESAFTELRQRRIAVLVAEQNLSFASQVASRYIVLSGGRIVATGGKDDLTDHDRIFAAYLGFEAHP